MIVKHRWKFPVLPYVPIIRPCVEYCIQMNYLFLKRDALNWEKVHKRIMKMIFSLKRRWQRWSLRQSYMNHSRCKNLNRGTLFYFFHYRKMSGHSNWEEKSQGTLFWLWDKLIESNPIRADCFGIILSPRGYQSWETVQEVW